MLHYVFVFCFFSQCMSTILLQHGGVNLMGLKPNPWDPIILQCFDNVVGSFHR